MPLTLCSCCSTALPVSTPESPSENQIAIPAHERAYWERAVSCLNSITSCFPVALQKFIQCVVLVLIYGAGMSAFSGAARVGGPAIGICSVTGNFVLNYNGAIDAFKIFSPLLCGSCFQSGALQAEQRITWSRLIGYSGLGLIAAIAPAVLSMQGIQALMKKDIMSVKILLAVLNGIVSTMVNVQSFMHFTKIPMEFFNKFVKKPFEQIRRRDSTYKNASIIIVGLFLGLGSMIPALLATISRGGSTYTEITKWLKNPKHTETLCQGLAYFGFSLTSLPGFAMFLNGLAGTFVFFYNLFSGESQGVKAKKYHWLFAMFAFIIVAFAAVFSFINYKGLAEETFSPDKENWVFSAIVEKWFGENAHLLYDVVGATAATNLLGRYYSVRDQIIKATGLNIDEVRDAEAEALLTPHDSATIPIGNQDATRYANSNS